VEVKMTNEQFEQLEKLPGWKEFCMTREQLVCVGPEYFSAIDARDLSIPDLNKVYTHTSEFLKAASLKPTDATVSDEAWIEELAEAERSLQVLSAEIDRRAKKGD
jgi:hypothetical protein